MQATYASATERGALKAVSAAKARSLETAFAAGSSRTEDLAAGRVGAAISGMVVDGELFVRTRVVRPGATPTWQSAGKLQAPARPKADEAPAPGWTPSTRSTDAQVRKAVRAGMEALADPASTLRGRELSSVKARIASGEAQPIDATPKGLLGVKYTGYVIDGQLIVEKRAVRPGATSSFHSLGALE